jgi:Domain of unknown function (DUF222)
VAVLEQVGDVGEWLVGFRRRLDAGEAEWLEALARFDLDQGWADDGQLSCVEWLMWRVGFARATAFDRLRVAHELRRRPALAAALREGRVSSCAVRAMARAEGTSLEVDEAFIAVAEAGTVTDVERVVRSYRLYRSQECSPGEHREVARGVRIRRCGDGMAKVEAVMTETEAAEVGALLDAVIERGASPDHAPVDGSTREDGFVVAAPIMAWAELRLEALLDVTRRGLGLWASGADRYMVHVVVRDGECSALGGDPLAPGERPGCAATARPSPTCRTGPACRWRSAGGGACGQRASVVPSWCAMAAGAGGPAASARGLTSTMCCPGRTVGRPMSAMASPCVRGITPTCTTGGTPPGALMAPSPSTPQPVDRSAVAANSSGQGENTFILGSSLPHRHP